MEARKRWGAERRLVKEERREERSVQREEARSMMALVSVSNDADGLRREVSWLADFQEGFSELEDFACCNGLPINDGNEG